MAKASSQLRPRRSWLRKSLISGDRPLAKTRKIILLLSCVGSVIILAALIGAIVTGWTP